MGGILSDIRSATLLLRNQSGNVVDELAEMGLRTGGRTRLSREVLWVVSSVTSHFNHHARSKHRWPVDWFQLVS